MKRLSINNGKMMYEASSLGFTSIHHRHIGHESNRHGHYHLNGAKIIINMMRRKNIFLAKARNCF